MMGNRMASSMTRIKTIGALRDVGNRKTVYIVYSARHQVCGIRKYSCGASSMRFIKNYEQQQ